MEGNVEPHQGVVDRVFVDRVGFDKVIRVALSFEQVQEYGLPFNPDPKVQEKLANDPRAKKFCEKYGYDEPVQHEVDALPPDVLRGLYQDAIDEFWDDAAYQAVLAQEEADKEELEGR